MKSNKFWTPINKVLVVATLGLLVLVLVAEAGAASQYKVLHKFTGTDGKYPEDALLIFDAVGNLYGTTATGGAHGNGNVFELTPNSDGSWTESVLYSFAGGHDPSDVRAEVIFGAEGNLYATSVSGGDYGEGTIFKLTSNSDGTWSESVIHSFTGGSDGAWAIGGVIIDAAGNLYGTTGLGGAWGGGVVFKLTPSSDGTWTESVLHSFTSTEGGYLDHGSLIFDTAGNLYGETSHFLWGPGQGTIFELMPNADGSWTEKVLHRFHGGKDGALPESTLTFDTAGNLYGTTAYGGGGSCSGYGDYTGCGTVFKLMPNSDGTWTETVLHRFHGDKDGAVPFAGLVFDTAGNLYGTTTQGGGGPCTLDSPGCGTVFKLTPNSNGGWTEQVLHRFQGKPAGAPFGEVVFDSLGNIYGIASGEGTNGAGAVFEITP